LRGCSRGVARKDAGEIRAIERAGSRPAPERRSIHHGNGDEVAAHLPGVERFKGVENGADAFIFVAVDIGGGNPRGPRTAAARQQQRKAERIAKRGEQAMPASAGVALRVEFVGVDRHLPRTHPRVKRGHRISWPPAAEMVTLSGYLSSVD